jgi:hypothetical protein
VVEHVGPGFDHFFERAVLAQEIGREHFDGSLRTARADGAHGVSEMRSTAVGEIVAVDASDDDVGKAELGGRLGDVFGLGFVECAGQAGLHVAEGAGARAGVAHDHKGGVLLLPALADVGAAGLLAHGVQAVGTRDGLRSEEAGRYRRLHADPGGLFGLARVGAMRLFGMARARIAEVENNGHAFTYGCGGQAARRRPMRCCRPGQASGGEHEAQ